MLKNKNTILIFSSYRATESSYCSPTTDEVERGVVEIIEKAVTEVSVDSFRKNINSFLENISTIISSSPQKMGELILDEIEINTQIDAKGNIGIAEMAVQGGIKFVLRNKS